MTEESVAEPHPVGNPPVAASLARMVSDPSGSSTFARYEWQIKHAARLWLTCLSGGNRPVAVICEHVEDVVVVYPDRLRFIQLKTRDRGSWSASQMCDAGNGLDALSRSYLEANRQRIAHLSTFELWLEGPESDGPPTVEFVNDPTTASPSLRKKISRFGLRGARMDDFLARLSIRPKQPIREHIDALAISEMGALWPGLTHQDLELMWHRLLDAATAAQVGRPPPLTIRGHLAAAFGGGTLKSKSADRSGLLAGLVGIKDHVLDEGKLRALTPSLPDEGPFDVLDRLEAGTTLSALERKMRAGGASEETIRQAKILRADAEVRRLLLVAGRPDAQQRLDELADRVLVLANATSRRIALTAAVNPGAANRSAESIAADLLSRPSELAALDRLDLFEADGFKIYGYLCHLSDSCRFSWRA